MSIIKKFECLGFNAREFDGMLSVTTPQTFISGDPVSFYIRQDYDNFIFEDHGRNLHSLELSLPNPSMASKIVKNQLSKFENSIVFDGYGFKRVVDESERMGAISEFISLFSLLTNYQPKSVLEQNKDLILENVFNYLRKKYDKVETEYSVKGLSGTQYQFDFLADDTLVDFTNPHPNATGALLRKIHDVQNLTNEEFEFRIIIDDKNPKIANKESKILSSVANTMPLSFISNAA